MTYAQGRVPVHSAHVGQIYRVHYRWPAYFGADVKVHQVLNRGDGQIVRIERDAGVVIDAPAWVLDAAFCHAFDCGASRVALEALFELHSVLGEMGVRRSFEGNDSSSEAQNDQFLTPQATCIATSEGSHTTVEHCGTPGSDHGLGSTASCGCSDTGGTSQ